MFGVSVSKTSSSCYMVANSMALQCRISCHEQKGNSTFSLSVQCTAGGAALAQTTWPMEAAEQGRAGWQLSWLPLWEAQREGYWQEEGRGTPGSSPFGGPGPAQDVCKALWGVLGRKEHVVPGLLLWWQFLKAILPSLVSVFGGQCSPFAVTWWQCYFRLPHPWGSTF